MATSGKIKLVTFVTGNPNKLRELNSILLTAGLSDRVVNKDIDLPELQGLPEMVAREKCRLAAERVGGPVLVEDTSLCFNALGGLPGVYIKWFLDALGPDGLPKLLAAFPDKSAEARCVFAYSRGPGQEVKVFAGVCPGSIADKPAGDNRFGWDPIFKPDGFHETFAQMVPEVKNTISHRAKALSLVRDFLVGELE
ncbi:hypothetical protein BOX15_Mlig015606g2 [Macrostomum lignano]|uniref:Inosine triphosphate pyrophosphatase n=1 Tax=Macrostomum lignano TaxID=282301 RepID=A0A267GLP5_9PLAT|nr:hypothetical protein BOX15_Mlig029812g1 [Macrostomum lignano]PAA86933.1 hypothetical protein BOX15_Mlig015606g2 [Macrostomum lignano]